MENLTRGLVASNVGAEQKILPAATFLPFVDQYGQFAHDDWPGKIHNDADLAAAREAEAAWLADNAAGPIPDIDQYGGWAGGPQLEATGYFRTEKVDGKWWLVDPEGHLFFSHGVNAVFTGAETGVGFRENYFAWLPAKNDALFGAFWSTPCSGPSGLSARPPRRMGSTRTRRTSPSTASISRRRTPSANTVLAGRATARRAPMPGCAPGD